ncbi:MAG: ATP-dependent DNA helicase [Gammaproteobacteria bacterium]|nr:MAG: ATP-dependent DNA helicase [Gammaproteobacteria bacterium]
MKIQSILSTDGIFEKKLENFKARAPQLDLSIAIESAIKNNDILISEAGTGVGKTFAYLVPAMLSGIQTIISTGTKHLQDQLFYSDIPKVQNTLELNLKIHLLKGRSNYLCLYRLGSIQQFSNSFNFYYPEREFKDIINWSNTTGSGEISELTSVSENSNWWFKVTSNNDNCLRSDCPQHKECYFYQARELALDADLLVVNHHLLCADMAIKEQSDGIGEILPSAGIFIIDEAHKIEQSATSFFSEHFSNKQINLLTTDIFNDMFQISGDYAIKEYTEKLNNANLKLVASFGPHQQKKPQDDIKNNKNIYQAYDSVIDAIGALQKQLKPHKDEKSIESHSNKLSTITSFLTNWFSNNNNNDNNDKDKNDNHIKWFEVFKNNYKLHKTPLSIANYFSKHIHSSDASWIFTSATLSINNNFNDFQNKLGIKESQQIIVGSPFDYNKQAMLYTNKNDLNPQNSDFIARLMESAKPLIKAANGRCFLLFSSYKSLNEAVALLKDEFSLLVQGDMPKMQLTEKFITDKNSILLATKSFWEGVDVKGQDLCCVIIDKIPFSSPADPVFVARANKLKQQNLNPFEILSIPEAVITLKQGAGRLIRGVDDYGVLMIGDGRINSKFYGKTFLNSLSYFPHTQDTQQVINFLHEHTGN